MSGEQELEIPHYVVIISEDDLRRYLEKRGRDIQGSVYVLRARAISSLKRTASVPEIDHKIEDEWEVELVTIIVVKERRSSRDKT